MPFRNKEYELELKRGTGCTFLAKAYSRLLRTVIINEAKVRSESQINTSIEFDARFSEAAVTNQPNTSKIVPTTDFRRYLVRRIEQFNNFE